MTQQRVSPVIISSSLPGVVTQTIRGALGQSVNIQEWQSSTGTVLIRVASNGDLLSTATIGAPYFSDGTATRPYIDFTTANKLIVQTRNASYVGLTVKGAASQTANLQEWQNSAGTVLASIDSTGAFSASGSGTMGTFSSSTDASRIVYVKGLTNGLRLGTTTGGASVEGVDSTNGVTSYQPLKLGGSTLAFETGAVQRATIDANGNVGIGQGASSIVTLIIGKAITGGTDARAIQIAGSVQSDVTGTARLFFSAPGTQATAFTLASLIHFQASGVTIGAGSAVTTNTGFLSSAAMMTSGVTNAYGFRGLLASATGAYNLYMDGTADNYIAGAVGIGATPGTSTGLAVAKTITGSAYRNIVAYGTVNSDITGTVNSIENNLYTQAAAFTLSNYSHFVASQGIIGTGSTVANQYGFNVSSNMVGATSNYGFWGNIPSGTGRWNAYMGGTAANYFAGQTTVGSNSLTLGSGSVAQQFGVVSTAASNIAEVIRGAASQTGDLTQWQNSAGTVLARVDSSGNVGIGTVPAVSLDVATTAGTAIRAQATTAGVDNRLSALGGASLAGIVGTYSNHPLAVFTNATERMRIDSSGNVGIGTMNPTADGGNLALRIDQNSTTSVAANNQNTGSSAAAGITMSAYGGTWQISTGSAANNTNSLVTKLGSTEFMRIDSSGNVGIGTSSPSTYGTLSVVTSGTPSVPLVQFNSGNSSFASDILKIYGFANNSMYNALNIVDSASNVKMVVRGDGSTGIGTTSMSGKLNVQGSTAGISAYFTDAVNSSLVVANLLGGVTLGTDGGGAIHLATNGAAAANRRLSIDASGNTTINTIAAGTTATAAVGGGYMGMPQNALTATGTYTYTFAASDAGKHVYVTGTPTSATLTINSNANLALPIGTTFVVMNDLGAATNISIAITTDTLQLAGTGTTGTRTLARYGMATIVKVTSTKWIISGNGLT